MRRGLKLSDLLLALALLAGLTAIAWLLRAEDIAGPARAIDGDTLGIERRRIRIKGIDAPELGQTCQRGGATYRCGEVAREALREMIAGREVMCRTGGRDRYDRDLAVCAVRGTDIGAVLVRRGLALAYGSYEGEEREARSRKVGLWAGAFEPPAEWRRRHAPTGPD